VFLREGRKSWPELHTWRKAQTPRIATDLFLNMLTWLEGRRLVKSSRDDRGRICWMSKGLFYGTETEANAPTAAPSDGDADTPAPTAGDSPDE
jgi:hypothetical protein